MILVYSGHSKARNFSKCLYDLIRHETTSSIQDPSSCDPLRKFMYNQLDIHTEILVKHSTTKAFHHDYKMQLSAYLLIYTYLYIYNHHVGQKFQDRNVLLF